MSGGNDSFTKILLHMDGSNGGTTFADSNYGGSSHTWTANSATTSTTQIKFGTTSLSVGSTGWIDTPDSVDFTVGTGDFTVDFWFWVSGGAGASKIAYGQMDSGGSSASTSLYGNLSAGNVWQANFYVGTTITTVTGTTVFTTPGWHHYGHVRASGICKLFLDGVQEGGNVSSAGSVNDSSNKFSVGRGGELASNTWNGFVDEFRLSVGIARWTANFTPPNAAYYLGIDAVGGAYVETGNAATFKISEAAATGSYTFAGSAAILGLGVVAGAGSFAETGNPATFAVSLGAAPGNYVVTGAAITWPISLGGTYQVTGYAATLAVKFLWTPIAPPSGAWTAIPAPATTWTREL